MTTTEVAPLETKPFDGQMLIQDKTGDTRHEWNKNVPFEVEQARKAFEAAKDKKYLAYRTKHDGTKGELLRTFDPDAEKIIMTPQLVGG